MPAISFQSVSKAYPSPRGPKGSSFLALDAVCLDIEEGEFFGLLGPNGAGKTTMISILAGLTRATGGKVSVLGSDVQVDFAAPHRVCGGLRRNRPERRCPAPTPCRPWHGSARPGC